MLAEAAPLFLLGAVIGAALEVWVKPEWIERWINRGHRSVLTAAAAGAILPGCAMSTMPIAQSLRTRGAAVGTVTAFIMIAPILSPHTIVLTATLISLPMALGRVFLSLAVTLLLGVALNAYYTRRAAPAAVVEEAARSCCSASSCCEEPAEVQQTQLQRFFKKLKSILGDLTPYLVGGLAVAAVLSALLPPEIIQRYLREGFSAYLIAVAAAAPVYVCDGGEIPLTRALLEMGVGPGPAFTFMLASVGTCLPTIAMALRIIGWGPTAIYLAAWLLLSVGGGLLMSLIS